jgi:hypothetical protein
MTRIKPFAVSPKSTIEYIAYIIIIISYADMPVGAPVLLTAKYKGNRAV